MLDAQFIRDNLDAVKANLKNRNARADVDRVVQLDSERKRLAQETQQLQERQNKVAQEAARAIHPVETVTGHNVWPFL